MAKIISACALLIACSNKRQYQTSVSFPCEIQADDPHGLSCKIKAEPKVIFK